MNSICRFGCVAVGLACFLIHAVGCTGDPLDGDSPRSIPATRARDQIRMLHAYATNSLAPIGTYADDVRASLAPISNAVEKTWLVKELERQIDSVSMQKVAPGRRRLLNTVVADLYGIVQDESYRAGGGRESVLEAWFREMEYFKNEIARCEAIRSRHVGGRSDEDWAGVVEGCKTEMAKTYYRIDFENHVAEIYCREHPEKKERFVRRVKNAIGRFPEWYAREQSVAGGGK